MHFSFRQESDNEIGPSMKELPEDIREAMLQFMKALSDSPNTSEVKLQFGEVKATSFHAGLAADGSQKMFPLPLSNESDGTRKLMSLAPDMERVLTNGGLLLVDELEREMHPLLVEMIVSKFQSPKSNPNHAQLIFTTHDTELLNAHLLRKDQLYFADKDRRTGASTLYSISDFSTHTSENIHKGYE